MHDQLLVQILQLQCNIAIAQVQCAEWRGPERYDAGTIVDGKNVGGKWKPSDKTGSTANSSPLKSIQSNVSNFWKDSVAEIGEAVSSVKMPTRIDPKALLKEAQDRVKDTAKLTQSREGFKKLADFAMKAGLFLGLTLGWELGVGYLLALPMQEVIASAIVGQAASFAVDKAIGNKIKNPWAKLGVELVANIAVFNAFNGFLVQKRVDKTIEKVLSDKHLAQAYEGIHNPQLSIQLQVFEQELMAPGRRREVSILSAADGTPLSRIAGTSTQSAVRVNDPDRVLGGIVTHNHPPSKSFPLSITDIVSSIKGGFQQTRAVTPSGDIFIINHRENLATKLKDFSKEELAAYRERLQTQAEQIKKRMEALADDMYENTSRQLGEKIRESHGKEPLVLPQKELLKYGTELDRLTQLSLTSKLRKIPELNLNYEFIQIVRSKDVPINIEKEIADRIEQFARGQKYEG